MTSSIFWILALILGGSLLTSCSGSIFGNKKSSHPSGQNPHQEQVDGGPVRKAPPTEKRTVGKDDPNYPVDGDGHKRDIVGPIGKDDAPSAHEAPRGRSLSDPRSLKVLRILFPKKISDIIELNNERRKQRMSEQEENDLLDTLQFEIVVHSPTPSQLLDARKLHYHPGLYNRKVDIFLRDDLGHLLSSASLLTTDSTNALLKNVRNLYTDGYLENRDNKKTIFVGFSLRFKNNRLDAGNILEYKDNGDAILPGYALQRNTRFKVSYDGKI